MKIGNEFNAISIDLNNRTIDQLKRCYENKKQVMRKKKAQVRQEVLKTGGGFPPPITKKDELDDLVLATMDPITVEGHYNQFDSDVSCPVPGTSSAEIKYVFENSENASENAIVDEGDYNSFSEATLEINTTQLSSCSSTPSKRKSSPIEKNLQQKVAPTLKEEEKNEKSSWKHFNTNDLKRPLNPALLQPGTRNKYEMEDESEEEQIIDPEVLTEIDTNKINRGSGVAREGTRGRGTPRRGPDRRRPTATVVRTLASNALAEKYEYLADKKNIIADHTIKKIERERLHAEEEHRLRKECLQLDVQIKKKQLEKLSH
ncbi:unnamed protein product [Psylliodes chrysocephalus]|uniref:Regulatory protein zeste n=1 Tax=Psylliodes chrysocephalus TaxID=3402493 RepID=A0A9P0GBU0_9CUCU|nr:unnamed protein product [Psylliodes chrysocephala]